MTGSLQIKNGKYYAVINYKNSEGKRKQKWINTQLEEKGNKRKAEQILHRTLLQFSDFSEVKSDFLFSDYLLKWLENAKGKVEESTWEGYTNTINKHIYPYFKRQGIKLIDITAKDISAYYNIKIKEGLSPNTIKKAPCQHTKVPAVLICGGFNTDQPCR